METLFRKVKCSERLPKVPGYYFALDKKGHQMEWQYEGNYIIGAGAGIDWWLEELQPQEQMTVEEINELIQPHAITLEHGEKAAQTIHSLVYGEKPPKAEE